MNYFVCRVREIELSEKYTDLEKRLRDVVEKEGIMMFSLVYVYMVGISGLFSS